MPPERSTTTGARSRVGRAVLLGAVFTVAAGLAPSCSCPGVTPPGDGDGDGDCVPTTQFFQEKIWDNVMSKTCIDCHTTGGIASGTRLLLYPENMDLTRTRAARLGLTIDNGIPLLLLKPSGQASHTGGELIPVGSEVYEDFEEFAERLQNPVSCDAEPFAEIDCNEVEPSRVRVRLLTRGEVQGTLTDVFGIEDPVAFDLLPIEPEANGYHNNASALRVQQLRAEQILAMSEAAAARFSQSLPGALPCDPSGDEAGCARTFLETVVPLAFRRPATSEELDDVEAVYQGERNRGGTFNESITLAVQAVIASPSFLYRKEIGTDGDLTAWEVAENLAYTLTSAPPDATLRATAADGSILNRDTLEAQARRLLDSPRGRARVSEFFFEWLGLDRIDRVEKSPTVYPLFGGRSSRDMREAMEKFIEYVVFEADGTLDSLLTSDTVFLNDHLASIYGLRGGGGGGGGGGGEQTYRIEETDMIEEPNGLGYATGGNAGYAWIIWADGGVLGQLTLPEGGQYDLTVATFSDYAAGEPAQAEVWVDDQFQGTFASLPQVFEPSQIDTFSLNLSAGTHNFVVRLVNDLYDDLTGEDRNLYVDYMEVTGPIGGATGDGDGDGEFDDLGPELEPRSVPDRPGILTRGALLASFALPNGSSPVRRGLLIRRRLLCQELPPPPGNIDNNLPEEENGQVLTTRQRFEAHEAQPVCFACHRLIDGLGFALENFDGVGGWRTQENGAPVDPTGSLLGTIYSNGEYDDAVGLAATLAASKDVERCTVQNYYMFSMGEAAAYDLGCLPGDVLEDFEQSGGNLKELIISTVTNELFTSRVPE